MKDWTVHDWRFNAHCNYGPDVITQFTEGSHHGKRSYSWVCLQRVAGALTYEGHYELAVNIPYYNTIHVNYFGTIRSKTVDLAKIKIDEKWLPGLESYRLFKATLAPIDPTVKEDRPTPSSVPLLR